MPSYYESFGLVALEAMACGVPVIASRVGGPKTFVKEGETGYLIPWRCPEPYAQRIEMVLANPALGETHGEEREGPGACDGLGPRRGLNTRLVRFADREVLGTGRRRMSVEGQRQQSAEIEAGQSDSALPSWLRRAERHVGRRVGSGLLVLVPLLISVTIVLFVLDRLDELFRSENGFLRFMVSDRPWDFWGVGVLFILVLLYIIGAFFSGKRSQALQDAILTRIPVVRTIYGVARQATEAISTPMGHHFSRVVFVEWPRPGVGAMGFVTGNLSGKDSEEPLVAVYIPTVPNPTSGMLAFFSEDDITETNITVQDAMKTIFSGGIILPEVPVRLVLAPSPVDKDSSR